jgi:C4-dicarboxylate-specific signal transduction histidine kinase
MPLSGAGRLAAWIAVTAVLLACCAVVAVRGTPPREQEREEEQESSRDAAARKLTALDRMRERQPALPPGAISLPVIVEARR